MAYSASIHPIRKSACGTGSSSTVKASVVSSGIDGGGVITFPRPPPGLLGVDDGGVSSGNVSLGVVSSGGVSSGVVSSGGVSSGVVSYGGVYLGGVSSGVVY